MSKWWDSGGLGDTLADDQDSFGRGQGGVHRSISILSHPRSFMQLLE